MSRCGWLTSIGSVEACTERKWGRQARTGRKHGTVHSLMTYRHCCVMFMGELQTEGILTARLNNSLSKFIEKETERLERGKRVDVHVWGNRAAQRLSC